MQRFRDRDDHAEADHVIVDEIPGSRFHDGERLGFGPNGMLYATAGETFAPNTLRTATCSPEASFG